MFSSVRAPRYDNKRLTTPYVPNGRECRRSARVYYGSSKKVLLVERHIACRNRVDLCENHGFYYYRS